MTGPGHLSGRRGLWALDCRESPGFILTATELGPGPRPSVGGTGSMFPGSFCAEPVRVCRVWPQGGALLGTRGKVGSLVT